MLKIFQVLLIFTGISFILTIIFFILVNYNYFLTPNLNDLIYILISLITSFVLFINEIFILAIKSFQYFKFLVEDIKLFSAFYIVYSIFIFILIPVILSIFYFFRIKIFNSLFKEVAFWFLLGTILFMLQIIFLFILLQDLKKIMYLFFFLEIFFIVFILIGSFIFFISFIFIHKNAKLKPLKLNFVLFLILNELILFLNPKILSMKNYILIAIIIAIILILGYQILLFQKKTIFREFKNIIFFSAQLGIWMAFIFINFLAPYNNLFITSTIYLRNEYCFFLLGKRIYKKS